jgi:hypothetical protein
MPNARAQHKTRLVARLNGPWGVSNTVIGEHTVQAQCLVLSIEITSTYVYVCMDTLSVNQCVVVNFMGVTKIRAGRDIMEDKHGTSRMSVKPGMGQDRMLKHQ